jgi:hypothetical protein
LHCGQTDRPGACKASWERRMSRFDFDVFFFGTAMIVYSPWTGTEPANMI